jgi:hypothetical protein
MVLLAAAILVAFTTPVMAGQVELWVTVCCGSGNNTGVRAYDYTNKVFNSTPEAIHKHNNEGYPATPYSILYVPGVGASGSMIGTGRQGAGLNIGSPSSQGRDVDNGAQNAAYRLLDEGGNPLNAGEGQQTAALGKNNRIYYTDFANDKIVSMDYDGNFASVTDWVPSGVNGTSVGGGGSEFNNEKSGLYIADNGGSQLIIYNELGLNRQTYDMSGKAPKGLEFHPGGDLYVASAGNQVWKLSNFDANGVPQAETLVLDAKHVLNNPDGVSDPRDIAFHPQMSNTIFVSEGNYHINAYNLTTGAKRFNVISTGDPVFSSEIEFTPEPATLGLMSVGALAMLRRRRTA